MSIFSRRKIIHLSGTTLIYMIVKKTLGAKSTAPANPLNVRLMQEFVKKQVLDISPDGMKLCLEDWNNVDYPLQVVEIGSGNRIYSGVFETRVRPASFFANSRALLAVTLIRLNSKTARHLTVVDLQSAMRKEGLDFADNRYKNSHVEALGENILLITDIDWSSIEKCSIVLAEFPNYREVAKAPFVIKPNGPEHADPADSKYALSNDRSIFIYSYGRTLACRQTKDLAALWTRKIEPSLMVRQIASPNTNYVAAAIADTGFRDMQKESYIAVYNGITGVDINRLPICGTEGLALSADGSLLAVVERVNNRNKKMYFLYVRIYDVKSGKILALLEHDRIKWELRNTSCRIYFTADGQYVISSGMNTKVWKIGRI